MDMCCFQSCSVTHGAKIGIRYFKYLVFSFTIRKKNFTTLIELKQTLKFFLISFYTLICNYEYFVVMCALKHISWNQATKCGSLLQAYKMNTGEKKRLWNGPSIKKGFQRQEVCTPHEEKTVIRKKCLEKTIYI